MPTPWPRRWEKIACCVHRGEAGARVEHRRREREEARAVAHDDLPALDIARDLVLAPVGAEQFDVALAEDVGVRVDDHVGYRTAKNCRITADGPRAAEPSATRSLSQA